MFVDFEKAFISIDHGYNFKTLTYFNSGPDVVQWIIYSGVSYTNTKSCVINNDYLSAVFSMKSGTRQSRPLSLYIFNFMIKILSILIRERDSINEFRLYDSVVKISAYADDVTVLIRMELKRMFKWCANYLTSLVGGLRGEIRN